MSKHLGGFLIRLPVAAHFKVFHVLAIIQLDVSLLRIPLVPRARKFSKRQSPTLALLRGKSERTNRGSCRRKPIFKLDREDAHDGDWIGAQTELRR